VSGDQVFALLLEMQARHHTTAVLDTHNPAIAERCGAVQRLEGGVLHPVAPHDRVPGTLEG
jgi:predicted ABC-type transport system involved in lysophospholipase L1 biosynthesis ATPase subunit